MGSFSSKLSKKKVTRPSNVILGLGGYSNAGACKWGKMEACSMQRLWNRQNWMLGIVFTDIITVQISINWEWYVRCMQGSGQMRTCLVILESWLWQGQQALSHLPQQHIMHPVAECPYPETNLEYHSHSREEADFSALVRAGQLIKAKTVGGICCFFVTPCTCMHKSQDVK